jgi:monovalent cation:H+ antiporter-2, CPA2 family
MLHYIAHTGSRELFRLAVLTIAFCVAFGAAKLFGVSLALGAFFAGMILSESPLSQRAAQESLPLRDAFAVLFFVSVGMLFDPATVWREPWLLAATLFIIIIGKSLAALLIVLAFRYSLATALMISASLAQIGEFSFILAELGVPKEGRDLILAGAIISILLNPLIFAAVDWLTQRLDQEESQKGPAMAPEDLSSDVTVLTNHTILVGYGRVGSIVAAALQERGRPYLVVEAADSALSKLQDQRISARVETDFACLLL